MAKQLLIIGAGGLGRETLTWALQAQNNQTEWEVCGFLDGNREALSSYPIPGNGRFSVVGDPNTYKPSSNDLFVCAIGEPTTKMKICRKMQEQGAQFTNVIHPTALIGPGCKLGVGNIICPYVTLTTNVTLGDFNILNIYAGLGHDSVLADGCILNGKCEVNGNAKLEEGVYMGCQSAILPGVKVGAYSRIGAGSVAVRNVRPQTTVMGVPAKKLFSQADFQKPKVA